MTLLHAHPEAQEVVLERAKFVRYAEANGAYSNVLSMLSAIKGPHS